MKSTAAARVDVDDDGNENDDDEERRRRRIVMNEEPGWREQEGTRHDTKMCHEVVFCLVQVWTGKAEEMGGGDG